jgi:hypothetical protein
MTSAGNSTWNRQEIDFPFLRDIVLSANSFMVLNSLRDLYERGPQIGSCILFFFLDPRVKVGDISFQPTSKQPGTSPVIPKPPETV